MPTWYTLGFDAPHPFQALLYVAGALVLCLAAWVLLLVWLALTVRQ